MALDDCIPLFIFHHFDKPVNKLNKYINIDIKNLTNWFNATKISLNDKKTEIVIYRINYKLQCPIKTKFSMKTLYPSESVKYLGVKIDDNLN